MAPPHFLPLVLEYLIGDPLLNTRNMHSLAQATKETHKQFSDKSL
jgi:hypothetical protein